MDAAVFARVSAVGRLGFGAGLLIRPRMLTRPWLGEDADRVGAQVLTRLLGMRDLVIGAGTLASNGADRRRWLAAAVAADAADLTVTLAAGRALPVRGRILVALAAAGGVALGAAGLVGPPAA